MIRFFATRLFVCACIAGMTLTFSACNTIHGAGQDIERGGEKIQQKADEHR